MILSNLSHCSRNGSSSKIEIWKLKNSIYSKIHFVKQLPKALQKLYTTTKNLLELSEIWSCNFNINRLRQICFLRKIDGLMAATSLEMGLHCRLFDVNFLKGQFAKWLKLSIFSKNHCVKSVQIRAFFWSVFSCIQTEYRKIQTKKNCLFGHFSRSESFQNISPNLLKINSDIDLSLWIFQNWWLQRNLTFNPSSTFSSESSEIATEHSDPKGIENLE